MKIGMAGPIVPSDFIEYLDHTINDQLPRGLGGTPVNQLCIELLKRGHYLIIFTLDKTVSHEVILSGPRLRICIGPYRPRPRDRAFDAFRVERRYIEFAVRREKPEIIHAQWTYEFAMGAKNAGVPLVVTAHDAPINILKTNFDLYRVIRTWMAYDALKGIQHLAAVSPHVADHLSQWRFHAKPITIIPNGLPQSNFDYFDAAHAARECRIGKPPVYATVLNGWAGLKNGPAALRAFSITRKNIPDARLIMFGAGHGPNEAGYLWAKKSKLNGNVEFVGQLPHYDLLRRLCEEVDVLVHPAREEAQSMAIIESLAMGLAVIGGYRSGGVPWTLAEGKAGRLVDIDDPEAIAKAMIELSDITIRKEIEPIGRNSVLNRFRIEAVADAYLSLYARILQGSR